MAGRDDSDSGHGGLRVIELPLAPARISRYFVRRGYDTLPCYTEFRISRET